MRVLKTGLKGPDVKQWQLFLISQGLQPGQPDGDFGRGTEAATIEFQKKQGLGADGKVGMQTFGRATQLGLEAAPAEDFPAKPSFPALTSNAARQQVFGKFTFEPNPLPGNAENIAITGTWQKDNIVPVVIPQLIGVPGAPSTGRIYFHKLAAPQLQAMWAEWETAGLLDRVQSWGGAFVPRFVRGSRTVLSNHSFGTAFDINMATNGLGVEPARLGMKGCVRELVPIAHKHGVYWGGHFSRRDGMHFEVAVLK